MHIITAFLLKIMGWKINGSQPEQTKYIIAVVPHTSSMDFVIGRFVATVMRVNVHFLIKKELFFFPLGLLLKALKAVPVNRKAPKKMIGDVVKRINHTKQFVLVVTPEGTRKKVKNWKKGFYFIAKKADIPILPAAIDYSKKEITLLELIYPSDNEEADFEKLVSAIKRVNPVAKKPAQFSYPF
jgi:1-acyl-sn-glycerol-3-phosphate acyltransferase